MLADETGSVIIGIQDGAQPVVDVLGQFCSQWGSEPGQARSAFLWERPCVAIGPQSGPRFQRHCTACRGRFAALSRHKAAPTGARAIHVNRTRPRNQLRSRTQNSVAPATAAGIISTFTPGIISAR